eukprot:Tbor_TRINITY_DN2674_c0_g1::TRINITY_DN2674_c0_g1_i1::g.17946::m.17946/K01556/KYNU, kynU; kynureninase
MACVHPIESIKEDFVVFSSSKTRDPVASIEESRDFSKYLDECDPLHGYRKLFHFPKMKAVLGGDHNDDEEYNYLCGNSLGLQHVGVSASIEQELTKWRDQAVEGHFLDPNPWFEIDSTLVKDMAHIVGAQESEVVIMNTLTCNLHLLLAAFYKPSGKRTKLVAENFPFPSDTHAFVSQVKFYGLDPEEHYINVGTKPGEEPSPTEISTDSFLKLIEDKGDEIAVIVIGAVHFLTGQFFDIHTITKAAHNKGIIVGVDAAHAVGNVPLRLHDWGVDFACWCTYKYLNGGPGNIGGAFVHDKHAPSIPDESNQCPVDNLRGWWGHSRSNRFALHRKFESAGGAASFQLSNPSVLCMMSLAPSVRLFGEITMPKLRVKSLRLTAYLEYLLIHILKGKIEIITPREPAHRGAQLSIRILPNCIKHNNIETEAYKCGNDLNNDSVIIQKQLLHVGIMCDNRPPDILRVAPTPTYNSFHDVYDFVKKLEGLFK